jgi:predicted metal-dependent phosphoesterase TrpH
MTLHEVADVLSEAAGRTIVYHPETVDEAYESRAAAGVEDYVVAGWVSSYEAIAAGALEHVSHDVPRLVGRPSRSLAQWLDDYPAEWAHLLVHETG